MRLPILVVVLFLALALPAISKAQAPEEFDTALYFPIEPGEYSMFLLDDIVFVTSTVLDRVEVVNGVTTQVIEDAGGVLDGQRRNATNDIFGARTHRLFTPDLFFPGFGFFDRTITLIPPLKRFDQFFELGETNPSNGTAMIEFSDGSSSTANYNASTRVVGPERIDVPFGTFDSIAFQEVLTLSDSTGSATVTVVSWRVPGLGKLRVETTEQSGGVIGPTSVAVLTTTNREFVPEPSLETLQLSAFTMIGITLSLRKKARSRS